MSTHNNNNNNGGIGFLGGLSLLFIGLKLTGNIGWSWAWVLSPIWVPFSLLATFVIILYILQKWGDASTKRNDACQ